MIPTIIGQIAAGETKIVLGALHPTRDFTFVQDTARGFIQAMSCDDLIGQTVNIGSSFEVSIGDLAQMIADIMGADITIETEGQRLRPDKSEVERLLAGTQKAQKLMGWSPSYAGMDGLRRGLGETIEWFRNPANLKLYKTGRYNI